jgi:tetratricopeptide (TPR) repeat protein
VGDPIVNEEARLVRGESGDNACHDKRGNNRGSDGHEYLGSPLVTRWFAPSVDAVVRFFRHPGHAQQQSIDSQLSGNATLVDKADDADRVPQSLVPAWQAELKSLLLRPGAATELESVATQIRKVSAAYEAVDLRRQLADSQPGTHRRELARSLESLSAQIWEMIPPFYGGYAPKLAISVRERALAPLDEAVILYRAITEEHGHASLEDLARSVEASARCRWDIARLYWLSTPGGSGPVEDDQAMAASEEAVALYRQLAAGNPEEYRPHLARVLISLMHHRWKGVVDPSPALEPVEEAILIYRTLADEDPEEYQFMLAYALDRKNLLLFWLGDKAGAIAAVEEAITACLPRASIEPKAWRLLADLRIQHGGLTGRRVPTNCAGFVDDGDPPPEPLDMPPKPPNYAEVLWWL